MFPAEENTKMQYLCVVTWPWRKNGANLRVQTWSPFVWCCVICICIQ